MAHPPESLRVEWKEGSMTNFGGIMGERTDVRNVTLLMTSLTTNLIYNYFYKKPHGVMNTLTDSRDNFPDLRMAIPRWAERSPVRGCG